MAGHGTVAPGTFVVNLRGVLRSGLVRAGRGFAALAFVAALAVFAATAVVTTLAALGTFGFGIAAVALFAGVSLGIHHPNQADHQRHNQ